MTKAHGTTPPTLNPDPDCYLSLGELNNHLPSCSVNARQLEGMGFSGTSGAAISKAIEDRHFARKYRSATLYKVSDIPRIKAAVAKSTGCATGEAFAIGELLVSAPQHMPAGYEITLSASPAGFSLSIQYPDGTSAPVNCTPPLSACLKTAIGCARADAAIKEKLRAPE